ncbi:MAG: hypothetical protein HYX76_16605 [Acidobacteria bacterium]|nr:hypothetical protein [Acidobacteriota bacterium]
MGTINVNRVMAGGLVAGLIMNVSEAILNTVVLGAQMEAALQALNRPPVAGGAIAIFVVMQFLIGIVAIWIYAAIRPRFGPGPRTAVYAGLAVWVLAYVNFAVGGVAMQLFPVGLLVAANLWGLAEVIVAALAGAYFYREDDFPARHPAASAKVA